jgi:hypothetical protein
MRLKSYPLMEDSAALLQTGDGHFLAYVQSYWYFRPSLARVGLRKIKLIEGNGKFRSL